MPEGFSLRILIGVVKEGVSPSCINNVLSPDLHKTRGAVCADLHTEAPYKKRQFHSYSAGGRCLATAAVLVAFDVKSNIRSIKG